MSLASLQSLGALDWAVADVEAANVEGADVEVPDVERADVEGADVGYTDVGGVTGMLEIFCRTWLRVEVSRLSRAVISSIIFL